MTIKVSYTYASPVYINIGYGPVDGGAVWGDITGTLSNQADLQAALNAKVPYSGATGNVNLGEYELKAGQLTFDTSPTGTATVATMRWNDTTGLTETTLKGGNVVLKNGVDLVARVVNKVSPNTTLTKAAYQAVRVSGAQGQRLAVAFAQANNDNNSADTIGLVTETIATNQEGFIITVGQLEGINTTGSLQGETWVDGDVLYLSPTTAGALTNVKPVAPQHLVIIGYVEYAHPNNGKIYVKVMNGWELGELHDVNTTGATNGSVLKYNGSIWVPSSDTGITTLNTLTALSQSFATGTSGTDFNISSATSTHTFNLPSASATNRGLLTSADWSTFNGKENVLTFSSPLSRSTNTISIPQATSSVNGFLSSTDWTTFNNKQNALTNPVTGTGTSGQVAYWSGTNTQTGSNNLFWDATNNRLRINTQFAVTNEQNFNVYGSALFQPAAGDDNKIYIGNNESLPTGDGRLLITPFRIKLNTGAGTLTINADNLNSGGGISLNARNTDSGSLSLLASGTQTLKIFGASRNVLIQNGGTFTDSGQRLQVTGDTLLKGSGNTSATTALTVQNSDAANAFRVLNNGQINLGNSASFPVIRTVTEASVSTQAISGTKLLLISQDTETGSGAQFGFGSNTLVHTSGNLTFAQFTRDFTPTSGTGTVTTLRIAGAINQTGGANGITRGLYVNPTLTAAADWRSIEWSNSTGWGLYGAGTSPNYVAGSLGVGSTTLTGYNLRVSRGIVNDGSGNGYGIVSDGSPANLLGSTQYFRAQINTSVGTNTDIVAYAAVVGTSSATITNLFGFVAGTSLTSATNNYGFYGNIASSTGRWNLYMNGSASNYLNGTLLVGSTSDNGLKLQVTGDGYFSGSVGIGSSSLTGYNLRVSRGIVNDGSGNGYGIASDGTPANLLTSTQYFRAQINTSAGTQTDIVGYAAVVGTSVATITNLFGFVAGSSLISATNNFGFYGNIAAGTGRWNFYAAGSALNYFNGNTIIGTLAADSGEKLQVNGTMKVTGAAEFGGNVTLLDADNIIIGTTNGTKLGTATSQKIGFWNATPIVQPTTAVAAAAFVANTGTAVNDASTFDGYTMRQVVKALRNAGLLA